MRTLILRGLVYSAPGDRLGRKVAPRDAPERGAPAPRAVVYRNSEPSNPARALQQRCCSQWSLNRWKRIRVEGVKGKVTALDLPGRIQQAGAGTISETEAASCATTTAR